MDLDLQSVRVFSELTCGVYLGPLLPSFVPVTVALQPRVCLAMRLTQYFFQAPNSQPQRQKDPLSPFRCPDGVIGFNFLSLSLCLSKENPEVSTE